MQSQKRTTFDQRLQVIESAILSLVSRIGPLFVALIPAMFTGHSIFTTFENDHYIMALAFAIVTATGLEVSAIKITHTCVDMFRAGHLAKGRIMALASVGYAVGVVLIIAFSHEAFAPVVRWLGYVSPFLALCVYMAVAFSRQVEHIDTSKIDAKEAAANRRKELKLAQIEAEKEVKLARGGSHDSVKIDAIDAIDASVNIDAIDAISRAILADPDRNQTDLADRMGVSRSTVTRRKRELKSKGLLNGSHK